jgi:hypothetical protein
MVILENSAFLSIQRGLCLKSCIQYFFLRHGDSLPLNKLTEEDWEQLTAIEEVLRPFKEIEKRLGQAKTGSHGVTWEALPALDYLLTIVERQKRLLEEAQEALNVRHNRRNPRRVNPLLICYQNTWES